MEFSQYTGRERIFSKSYLIALLELEGFEIAEIEEEGEVFTLAVIIDKGIFRDIGGKRSKRKLGDYHRRP